VAIAKLDTLTVARGFVKRKARSNTPLFSHPAIKSLLIGASIANLLYGWNIH
jgi:hypothetical protein